MNGQPEGFKDFRRSRANDVDCLCAYPFGLPLLKSRAYCQQSRSWMRISASAKPPSITVSLYRSLFRPCLKGITLDPVTALHAG